MWLLKPAVVIAVLWWLLDETTAGAAALQSVTADIDQGVDDVGSDLQCAADEFVGLWHGTPTCLHHGTISDPMDGGPIDSGPVTSPDSL